MTGPHDTATEVGPPATQPGSGDSNCDAGPESTALASAGHLHEAPAIQAEYEELQDDYNVQAPSLQQSDAHTPPASDPPSPTASGAPDLQDIERSPTPPPPPQKATAAGKKGKTTRARARQLQDSDNDNPHPEVAPRKDTMAAKKKEDSIVCGEDDLMALKPTVKV